MIHTRPFGLSVPRPYLHMLGSSSLTRVFCVCKASLHPLYVNVELITPDINKVQESEAGVGFDALKEEYVDMVKAGILDPAKVTRSALQNATSVASTLLTTESVVANIKEDTPAMPAGGPGMGAY